MFGDASLVMTPKYPSTHQTTDQFLFEVYKPYLTSDFTLVSETQWWRLYRRLKPAPAASSDPTKD